MGQGMAESTAQAELFRKLFRQALLIRRVEEKIIEIYPTDKIQSPVHLSIGQEAVSVGLCAAMRTDAGDLIYGTYRSHALYIAVGGDLTKMFAELMGRSGGLSKGKAGSMHLTYPDGGFMGASAVVASQLPHAVGSAYAAKLRKSGQVIACVFGDGSVEEGVAHESFNFAALRKLPVMFLCENNGLAVHSHISDRQAFTIEGMANLYDIPYTRIDSGWDVMEVQSVCAALVGKVREGSGPQFLEVATFRYKEHVGTGDDFNYGYRPKEPFDAWVKNDPLVNNIALRAELIDEIDSEISIAIEAAEKSKAPGISELLTDVI